MRRVAAAVSMSRGALQFHLTTHDEMARAVIRAWSDEISRRLEEIAGDARGLMRTWKLSEGWVGLTDGVHVVLDALLLKADSPEHQGERQAVIEKLRAWIEETRRSLRQAQLKHELKPEVDVREVAMHVHQLLWSRSWTSALERLSRYRERASVRTAGSSGRPRHAPPPAATIPG